MLSKAFIAVITTLDKVKAPPKTHIDEIAKRRVPVEPLSPMNHSTLVAVAGALYRWGLQEAPLPAIY
jgi:hypothetical protein